MANNDERNKSLHVELTIPKDEFKEILQNRIDEGEDLQSYHFQKLSSASEFKEVEFFQKFSDTYEEWHALNIEILKNSFSTPENDYLDKYNFTYLNSNFPQSTNSFSEEIYEFRTEFNSRIKALRTLISLVPFMKTSSVINKSDSLKKEYTNEVFIVHGHNEKIRREVELILRRLNLIPITLNQKANKGMTVLEKFEANSNVGYAIILLTADDIGYSLTDGEITAKKRARQNVLLELGFFWGAIRRSNFLCLYEDGVELPSDLSGLVYVKYDEHQKWADRLVIEMREAGYDVSRDDL